MRFRNRRGLRRSGSAGASVVAPARMAGPGNRLRDLAERILDGRMRGADVAALARELGLVTRAEREELELRIAQLEHRVRLLEDERSPG